MWLNVGKENLETGRTQPLAEPQRFASMLLGMRLENGSGVWHVAGGWRGSLWGLTQVSGGPTSKQVSPHLGIPAEGSGPGF